MMYLPKILIRHWSAVSIALLTLTMVSSSLRAADVAVDCKNGGDLQAAINGAADGDILTIKGICPGPFIIDESTADDLKLEGIRNATLVGDGASTVITVFGRTVVFENLNIEGGGGLVGGLALVFSDVMLLETNVTENHADGGFTAGGIESVFTALTIIDSQVTHNTASSVESGFAAAVGGIASFGGELTVDNSIIQDNHASATETSGVGALAEAIGGIQHLVGGSATITNTRVAGNSGTASPSGFSVATGGISAIFSGAITIFNSQIPNNQATASDLATGGLEVFSSGPIVLNDSSVNRNIAEAPFAIGGVNLDGTDLTTIANSNVMKNVASSTGITDLLAGGILGPGVGVVSLEDTNVKNNAPNDCVALICE